MIRLPRDLLTAAGSGSADHPLAIVLTRQRTRPSIPLRSDPELALGPHVRAADRPRASASSGQARISPRAPDAVIDRVLGVTAADGSKLVATSSRRLPGDIGARAVSAIDGDPSTHWSPAYLRPGHRQPPLPARAPGLVRPPRPPDRSPTAGTRCPPASASRPTARPRRPSTCRRSPTSTAKDASVVVPLDFPTVTGRDLRFVFDGVRTVKTVDWVSKTPGRRPGRRSPSSAPRASGPRCRPAPSTAGAGTTS